MMMEKQRARVGFVGGGSGTHDADKVGVAVAHQSILLGINGRSYLRTGGTYQARMTGRLGRKCIN